MEIKLRNLGTVNKNEVTLIHENRQITVIFSYGTAVGLEGFIPCTMQNYWNTTTGKLLNELEPDKKRRLTKEQFNENLNKSLEWLVKG